MFLFERFHLPDQRDAFLHQFFDSTHASPSRQRARPHALRYIRTYYLRHRRKDIIAFQTLLSHK